MKKNIAQQYHKEINMKKKNKMKCLKKLASGASTNR